MKAKAYVSVPGRNRRVFHFAIVEKIAFEKWMFFVCVCVCVYKQILVGGLESFWTLLWSPGLIQHSASVTLTKQNQQSFTETLPNVRVQRATYLVVQ